MGDRRIAREIAVQSLYEMAQTAVSKQRALESNIGLYRTRDDVNEPEPDDVLPEARVEAVRAYAERLLDAIVADRQEITQRIRGALTNWTLERVALVDRCVLEVGAVEILRFTDVPVKVVIDEAVDIARKFSTEESAGFVNGVLDRIARGETSTQLPAEADS